MQCEVHHRRRWCCHAWLFVCLVSKLATLCNLLTNGFFMEGCESCVASRCNSLHLVFKGMCGHLRAQRSGQYIFLKSPPRIRHVIRAGVSFSRDCLSCDSKWCFSTSSHVHVLRSWLTAANRCIVLQFKWDPPHLPRAWYVLGKIVPCCQIYLYLVVLNHDWLHFHENVNRHVRALYCVSSRTCWVNLGKLVLISTSTAEIIIKHAYV